MALKRTSVSEDEMDERLGKVEHAKAPAASADPAADLAAMLTEARGWAEGTALSDDANRKIWLMHLMADAIERLLRERDEVITSWRRNRRELMTERDAALRERDEARRQLSLRIGD